MPKSIICEFPASFVEHLFLDRFVSNVWPGVQDKIGQERTKVDKRRQERKEAKRRSTTKTGVERSRQANWSDKRGGEAGEGIGNMIRGARLRHNQRHSARKEAETRYQKVS